MKKEHISSLKIAAVYIGTVVGAGFATGQEVLQFFSSFGIGGIWGIVLSTLLFILFGILIMNMGFALSARSHLEIVNKVGGPVLGAAMDAVILVFLFGALTAMMAGTGAMFREQFGLSAVLGNLVMGVLTVMTVLTGIGGVINAISAIVPFLLLSVAAICIHAIFSTPPDLSAAPAQNHLIFSWPMSAVLYASYNIIMAISVLGPLGANAGDRKRIVRGAVLGGLGLGACLVMIFLAISGSRGELGSMEIPMSHLAGRIAPAAKGVFAIVLIAEIYSTAVGALYGLSARLSNGNASVKKTAAVVVGITASAFAASLLGFSNLVKYLYTLEGYVGLALLAVLLFSALKHRSVKT